jgi:hypothetical protein
MLVAGFSDLPDGGCSESDSTCCESARGILPDFSCFQMVGVLWNPSIRQYLPLLIKIITYSPATDADLQSIVDLQQRNLPRTLHAHQRMGFP